MNDGEEEGHLVQIELQSITQEPQNLHFLTITEMESMSLTGEPKRLAFDGSTVLAPSRKDRRATIEESSLLITSDFWWFSCNPMSQPSRFTTSRSCRTSSLFP